MGTYVWDEDRPGHVTICSVIGDAKTCPVCTSITDDDLVIHLHPRAYLGIQHMDGTVSYTAEELKQIREYDATHPTPED